MQGIEPPPSQPLSPDAAAVRKLHAYTQPNPMAAPPQEQQQGVAPDPHQITLQQLHVGAAGLLGVTRDRCVTCYGKCGQMTVAGHSHCECDSLCTTSVFVFFKPAPQAWLSTRLRMAVTKSPHAAGLG